MVGPKPYPDPPARHPGMSRLLNVLDAALGGCTHINPPPDGRCGNEVGFGQTMCPPCIAAEQRAQALSDDMDRSEGE